MHSELCTKGYSGKGLENGVPRRKESMSFLKAAAIYAIFFCLISGAQAKTALPRDVTEAIELAKQIMKTGSERTEFAKTSSLSIWMNEAFAEAVEYDCFYGGWPSQLVRSGGHAVCQNPKSFEYYQKIQAKENCGDGSMACNPLLFGPSVCVSNKTTEEKRSTFSNCESKFQNTYKGDYSFLTPEKQKKLTKLFDLVGKVCKSTTSPQHGTGMCNRFLKKLDEIKAKKEFPAAGKNEKPVKADEQNKKKKDVPAGNASGESSSTEVVVDSTEQNSMKKPLENTRNSNKGTDQGCLLNQPGLPKGIADACNALEKTDSVDELYNKIKKNYFQSGQCELYSDLPSAEKNAFKLKLYNEEIKSFRIDQADHQSSISESTALDTIIQDSGMSAEESQDLKACWSVLPPKSDPNSGQKRAEFQSKVLGVLSRHTNDPAFVKKIDERANSLFGKLGLPINNCDQESGDFVSLAAFREAYAARDQVQKQLKKPDTMTIIDRSLDQSARRMMTVDLKTGKVLYHTQIALGNGSKNVGFDHPESAYCSNKNGSDLTPYGYGVTQTTRPLSDGGGSFIGTFVATGYNGSATSASRGIAFHSYNGGSDPFGRYISEEQSANGFQSPGEVLSAAEKTPSQENVNYFLNIAPAQKFSAIASQGCVGTPERLTHSIQSTIQNGSYVYFYCPKKQ